MNPTVRAEELGTELRALRKANGLSLEEAGERISASAAKVSRIETGKCGGSSEDVAALLAVYRCVGSKRAELLDLARGVDRLGWWQRAKPDFAHRQRTLINLEARADLIVSFEGMNVPGLLQTGEYTRALMIESGIIPEAEVEGRMVTRMQRHAVLLKPDAPQLIAFIDELVLHRAIGGVDVLRRQLGHLVEAAREPNTILRVLPNAGGHAGANGAFSLIRRSSGHKVVFLENLTSSLFLEEPNEIKTYETAIRALGEHALDPQESIRVIAEQARKLEVNAG
ncbi:transcriptional regulator with XRE-family HTH domain [Saccharothrix coeruleofusca]|uniref:helix-turn-helix domain-containing protein n=1 Tax=Saccharothrix coeruleofusca TaxID=33919 RepID=UPI001AE5A80C|nr:helix-turn-helix transcriptional regulator [Saccharothrix coeruleofusca]MBP2334625.1 transcriptional regulator with XRE-family HTH domain [Saccharothrix coeruleofusca]